MTKFPKIKKTLSSFFLSEEGKTSKTKMFKTGVLIVGVSTFIISSSSSVDGSCKFDKSWGSWIYENIYEDTESNPEKHASHASHGSHGSHASHASHGSHGSHANSGPCGPCAPCS